MAELLEWVWGCLPVRPQASGIAMRLRQEILLRRSLRRRLRSLPGLGLACALGRSLGLGSSSEGEKG